MKTILFFLSFFTFVANAQNDSLICGPHSGAMKKAGHYFIEMANCTDVFQVFVYNRFHKPVDNNLLGGEVEFSYIDETFITSVLQRGSCNDLVTNIPAKGFYKCKITVAVQKEMIQANFDNECLIIIAEKNQQQKWNRYHRMKF